MEKPVGIVAPACQGRKWNPQDGFGKETKEIEMGNINPVWNASKQEGGSMKSRQAAKLGRKDHGMNMSV